MRRGQVTADFFITMTLLLIVLLVITRVASEKYTQAVRESDAEHARNIAQSLALGIDAVYNAGHGARAIITLPLSINTPGDYRINIRADDRLVEVTSVTSGASRYYTYPIITSDITGTINDINKSVVISNYNGGLTVG